jgi:hypothetical protein
VRLLLPLPHALDESLTAQILTGFTLILQKVTLHDILRGNPRMIASGKKSVSKPRIR